MGLLDYEKIMDEELDEYDSLYLQPELYEIFSLYSNDNIKQDFLNLKANIVDLDSALITKCIQGTEQDFLMIMRKAKEYLDNYCKQNDATKTFILDLFRDCVFGYYVLTPLIQDETVSDIKVYAWDNVTCKSNGDRYVTNVSFYSEDDYNKWIERIMRIHHMNLSIDKPLKKCTDRKGVEEYYLRIDIQLNNVTSTENYNIHIRKIPKKKYTWEYLKEKGMLNDEMIEYIKDRMAAGYCFLLSGKGGSGKTSLLNNTIDLIPFDESVLVSQESDELYSDTHPHMQFEHMLEFETEDGIKEVTLEDELRMGLLQDIDVFVVGEIKGGEALYVYTTAANTGARFMGTIHSNNAKKSIRRMTLCARFISNYSIEVLEEMLADMKISLIHMSRFSIDEIVEVVGWDYEKQELKYKTVYMKYESKSTRKK